MIENETYRHWGIQALGHWGIGALGHSGIGAFRHWGTKDIQTFRHSSSQAYRHSYNQIQVLNQYFRQTHTLNLHKFHVIWTLHQSFQSWANWKVVNGFVCGSILVVSGMIAPGTSWTFVMWSVNVLASLSDTSMKNFFFNTGFRNHHPVSLSQIRLFAACLLQKFRYAFCLHCWQFTLLL